MSDAALQFDNIAFKDDARAQENFRAALIEGLSRKNKSIPCRFLYDAAGSALFDKICETPEYYVTRAEMEILRAHAGDMAALAGPDCQLIELGSGSSRKTRVLLDALEHPGSYVAIDISGDHLRLSASALAHHYPQLRVTALCADYNEPLVLPPYAGVGRRLGFFPGSTIGNLTPEEALTLLSAWARQLGRNAAMVVGVDLKKDVSVLEAAYDDAEGVTAAFTKNILARANREAGANFVTANFAHEARYVPQRGCMEIHLRSLAEQKIFFSGRTVAFGLNERIHIENSFKYSVPEFQELAVAAGFVAQDVWTDKEGRFSVHYLTV